MNYRTIKRNGKRFLITDDKNAILNDMNEQELSALEQELLHVHAEHISIFQISSLAEYYTNVNLDKILKLDIGGYCKIKANDFEVLVQRVSNSFCTMKKIKHAFNSVC